MEYKHRERIHRSEGGKKKLSNIRATAVLHFLLFRYE
ncbi:hypothetical protein X975_22114, partial [Stegodyphus mimosarum]